MLWLIISFPSTPLQFPKNWSNATKLIHFNRGKSAFWGHSMYKNKSCTSLFIHNKQLYKMLVFIVFDPFSSLNDLLLYKNKLTALPFTYKHTHTLPLLQQASVYLEQWSSISSGLLTAKQKRLMRLWSRDTRAFRPSELGSWWADVHAWFLLNVSNEKVNMQ